MNKYIFGCFFLISGLLQANNCSQPHANSTMKLLVTDKSKEQGALSEVLKRVGYTTRESQNKFAYQLKSQAKLDDDPDFKNVTVDDFDFSLYGDPSQKSDLFILLIGFPGDSEYYYYFFRKGSNGCSLITQKPIERYSKYCDSFPDYYSFQGEDYVVLVGSSGGTGLLICDAELYEIDKNNVRDLGGYTYSGDCCINLCEEFASGPITIFSHGFTKTLQIPFKISFIGAGGKNTQPQFEAFSKTYSLNYDWNLLRQAFALNPVSSGITFKIEKDDGLYGLYPEDVFHRYYDELINIAKNGDPDQKKWLRDFLESDEMEDVKNSGDVKKLEKLLGKN